MKNYLIAFGLLGLSCSLSGCGLMEDAFKAGVIFALFIIAIVGLIFWLARMVAVRLIKKFNISITFGDAPAYQKGRTC